MCADGYMDRHAALRCLRMIGLIRTPACWLGEAGRENLVALADRLRLEGWKSLPDLIDVAAGRMPALNIQAPALALDVGTAGVDRAIRHNRAHRPCVYGLDLSDFYGPDGFDNRKAIAAHVLRHAGHPDNSRLHGIARQVSLRYGPPVRSFQER